jgi:hypothetical protein
MSKNTIKRVIVLFLALTTSLLPVLSCADKQASETPDTSPTIVSEDDASETSAEVTETTRLEPDLAVRDFGGLEITLLGRQFTLGATVKQFSETGSDKEDGELMNDAVYKRNRYVEEKYNVVIISKISEDYGSLQGDISKEVLAGDSTFDAAFSNLTDGANLSASGHLVDLKTLPNIDFSQPWWDQRAVADFSIGGKLFFTTGDITPWSYTFPVVFVVNKEMIAQYALEDPYENVRNNAWTFDKLSEYMKAVASDLNGDGVTDRDDNFGLIAYRGNFSLMLSGGGENVVKKDSEDIPHLSLNNERAVNVAEKLYNLFNDKQSIFILEDYPNETYDSSYAKFREGTSLFISTWMSLVSMYRDLDMDIGLLPQPKYDGNQENYSHPLSDWWSSVLVVPQTNAKLEETGFILEALCAESMYTVRPAFYENTFTRKMLRDTDSEDMLDIILNSRTYDLGRLYNWGGVMGTIDSMAANTSFTFASAIESKSESIEIAIQKTLEQFATQ